MDSLVRWVTRPDSPRLFRRSLRLAQSQIGSVFVVV